MECRGVMPSGFCDIMKTDEPGRMRICQNIQSLYYMRGRSP